jgi:hypothetical protein
MLLILRRLVTEDLEDRGLNVALGGSDSRVILTRATQSLDLVDPPPKLANSQVGLVW